MADTFFIEGLNTLPEQVQLNKEDIKTNTTNIATNTADITKLKDDIGKIKPNAWEQRKFILNLGEEGNADFTTYNPIIDTNAPVNFQKSFTGKDTYSIKDAINSYSFFTLGSLNGASMSIYAICTDPSNSLYDLLDFDERNEPGVSIVLFSSPDETYKNDASLFIICTRLTANNITSKSLAIKDSDANVKEINKITDNDDHSPNVLLTAAAIDQYYLKKSDASNTYLSKTDASNTYLSKTDASNTYLSKTGASNTYATINALKPLQNSYFDADLTPAGLAKIQANATIGTSITLDKDTDFIENITNTDLAHRTVIFSLYRDDDEEVYISENIKLDIVNTTDYYSDNDQPHIWFTGLGVIKLGSASAPNNNYLCYIAYDTTSTRGLMITPVQKLN